jgi:hypothetical protein
LELDEAALVECDLTSCPVLKGCRHSARRIGGQPLTHLRHRLSARTISNEGNQLDFCVAALKRDKPRSSLGKRAANMPAPSDLSDHLRAILFRHCEQQRGAD